MSAPPEQVVRAAIEAATVSPCGKSHRGAIVWRPGLAHRAHPARHNAPPAPFVCDNSAECRSMCRHLCVHAEASALLEVPNPRGAEMLHVKVIDGALVPSGGPSCTQCSGLILQAGIAGMWLYHADGWRRYDVPSFHALSLQAIGARLARGRR